MRKVEFFLIMVFLLVFAFGCTAEVLNESDFLVEEVSVVNYSGKKIMFVDSYHEGYEWSDGILEGIEGVLDKTDVELTVVRMDTKRNTDEEYIRKTALYVKSEIEQINPDVAIFCDDNAFRFVVMPYYKNADLPIVFCGINWDVSQYDNAPYDNTVGMIEIVTIESLVNNMKKYSDGETVGFLSGKTFTDEKTVGHYNRLFPIEDISLVSNSSDWKKEFLRMQQDVDILIIENMQNVSNWNRSDMEKFVYDNIKIPVVSTNSWMIPYALTVFSHVPEEQGEYSASVALDILSGKKLSDIAIVKNKKSKIRLNVGLVERLNVTFDPVTIKEAILYETEGVVS